MQNVLLVPSILMLDLKCEKVPRKFLENSFVPKLRYLKKKKIYIV